MHSALIGRTVINWIALADRYTSDRARLKTRDSQRLGALSAQLRPIVAFSRQPQTVRTVWTTRADGWAKLHR